MSEPTSFEFKDLVIVGAGTIISGVEITDNNMVLDADGTLYMVQIQKERMRDGT